MSAVDFQKLTELLHLLQPIAETPVGYRALPRSDLLRACHRPSLNMRNIRQVIPTKTLFTIRATLLVVKKVDRQLLSLESVGAMNANRSYRWSLFSIPRSGARGSYERQKVLRSTAQADWAIS